MPKEIQALSAPPVLLLLLLFWRFAPKSSCKKRPLLKLVPRIPRVRVEQYLPVCTIRRPTKVPAYVVYVRTVRRPLPETHVYWRMGAGATTKLLRMYGIGTGVVLHAPLSYCIYYYRIYQYRTSPPVDSPSMPRTYLRTVIAGGLINVVITVFVLGSSFLGMLYSKSEIHNKIIQLDIAKILFMTSTKNIRRKKCLQDLNLR